MQKRFDFTSHIIEDLEYIFHVSWFNSPFFELSIHIFCPFHHWVILGKYFL